MHCLLLQAEEALSNQLQRVNQIQEFHDQIDDEEKKWHKIMKLQEIEQQTKTWKSEIHQLNQASSQLL
jgi:cell wall assembly regulator SMI1